MISRTSSLCSWVCHFEYRKTSSTYRKTSYFGFISVNWPWP